MEEKFIAAWMQNREKAAAFGARMRPVDPATAMKTAHFVLGAAASATASMCWPRPDIWS